MYQYIIWVIPGQWHGHTSLLLKKNCFDFLVLIVEKLSVKEKKLQFIFYNFQVFQVKNDVLLKRCTMFWSEFLYTYRVLSVWFLVFELWLIWYFIFIGKLKLGLAKKKFKYKYFFNEGTYTYPPPLRLCPWSPHALLLRVLY